MEFFSGYSVIGGHMNGDGFDEVNGETGPRLLFSCDRDGKESAFWSECIRVGLKNRVQCF